MNEDYTIHDKLLSFDWYNMNLLQKCLVIYIKNVILFRKQFVYKQTIDKKTRMLILYSIFNYYNITLHI